MLTIELALIRVDEAIQQGLQAQHIQRSLGPRKKVAIQVRHVSCIKLSMTHRMGYP